jgi:maltodextrin utilization protein YvdJ
MSELNKKKDEAKELPENVKEEAKSVSRQVVVDEAKNFMDGMMTIMVGYVENLMDRIKTSMREIVEYVEQNWFMGGKRKMVASMVGVMMIIFGISLGVVFY